MDIGNSLPDYDPAVHDKSSGTNIAPVQNLLSSEIETKYIDTISDLNQRIESIERDKKMLRLEMNAEKQLTAELNTKLEELTIANEELHNEIKSLEKYKKDWENSLTKLKESESKNDYLNQLESEITTLKDTIKKLNKQLKEADAKVENETKDLHDQIEALEIKNVELLKHENMANMYKKKLDDLKDIKQSKRELEFERDNLLSQLEQYRIASSGQKDTKKAIEYYKVELEASRTKISEFEDALKNKNNEIVKIKNLNSKLEKDMKLKQKEYESFKAHMEELVHTNTDETNVDELKHKITLLENELNIFRQNQSQDEMKSRIVFLESEIDIKKRE